MSAGNAGAHTPLPWALGKRFVEILTPDGEKLLLNGIAMPCGNHPRAREADANARMIVCAVNDHAALLARVAELEAACHDALGELERQAKTHRANGWALSAACCEESARVVRAVLAKNSAT